MPETSPPTSHRHAARARRRYRRWPRRVLVTANVTVALLVALTAFGYGYIDYRLGDVRTGSGADLSGTDGSADVGQASGGLPPENILLIGNETRAGQTQVNFGSGAQLSGTLSDVIMILHLDPRAGTASILSIPRDLFAPMPAGSPVGPYQKIDAALNDGALGPNNLAAAITQDFGIRINHYVEVDFDGFLDTVNALGGIRMDFPELLYDGTSGLTITHTGCQLLNGQEALALVRSRHLQYDPPGVPASDLAEWPFDPESDLARIARDHTFVRVLITTAEHQGLSDPFKLDNFLGAVLRQLTIDPRLKGQLLDLALRYRHLDAGTLPTATIPVTQVIGYDGAGYSYAGADIGDVEFPDEPADLDAIRAWDPGALPVAQTPTAVQVVSLDGTTSLADQTGQSLSADGFHVTSEEAGSPPAEETETIVAYHPGQLGEGFDVFRRLAGAVVLQSDASVPAGTVQVQAGSTFTVVGDVTPSSTTTAPSSSPTTAATPSTTVPTPGGQAPSSAADQQVAYDPRPC